MDAVAQCVDCGRCLCQQCASKYEIAICDSCQTKRGGADLASLNRELYLYIGLGILGVVGGVIHQPPGMGVFSSMIGHGLAFPMWAAGWRWMTHVTDKISLFATIPVWIIYFVIKILLSAFVGFIALPCRLIMILKRKSDIRANLP